MPPFLQLSCDSGAKASFDQRTGPDVMVPTRGRVRFDRAVIAVNLATGVSLLRMTTSSPASTAASSRDSCVFASCGHRLHLPRIEPQWTKSRWTRRPRGQLLSAANEGQCYGS
jgi:hypothetical protein